MNRRTDKTGNTRFEINGMEYLLVKPQNAKELVAAIEVKTALEAYLEEYGHLMESGGYSKLLNEQDAYIQQFIDGLGNFDKNQLIKNINFMLSRLNLRMGELERIIGVSTGYISRTTKKDSEKKLSINTVWKIARLFGIDIGVLLETDLSAPCSNTETIAKFIDKLSDQTERDEIKWQNRGGVTEYLDKHIKLMGLFKEEEDGKVIYKPADHMNQKLRFVLADDIFTCSGIAQGKELAMIAFSVEDEDVKKSYFLDFLFLSKPGTSPDEGYYWEKGFYSAEDPFQIIKRKGEQLMSIVQNKEIDAELTPEARNIITEYLK